VLTERHDLVKVSDKSDLQFSACYRNAITAVGVNDTSVTRGSVTKKTERLDSYEANPQFAA